MSTSGLRHPINYSLSQTNRKFDRLILFASGNDYLTLSPSAEQSIISIQRIVFICMRIFSEFKSLRNVEYISALP